ncbi:MAG: hypothetical protein K2K46_02385 [Lachnospiraceae bacterium]|nr:hypothetical protein [Lachnospiraceae bacterium]
MYDYNMTQWLFFFYAYCFLGWCVESMNVYIRSGKFVNRGFIRGPFLPLYGSGAIIMFVVSRPFQDNILLTYVAGCIGPTVLEYVTGVVMEALFNVRYWDYSGQKFNFQGQICLRTTLSWGVLTIFMTRVVHRQVERFVLKMPHNILGYMTFILTVYIAADFALSFKAALDLRDVLAKMQRIKEELYKMQKRLDVLSAFNSDEKEQKNQESEQDMDELSEGLERRFNSIKETIQSAPGAVLEEIAELRARFNLYMENRRNYKEMLDFYKLDMIRSNPSMISKKFKDTLEDLKNTVIDKMNREGEK